MNKVIYVSILVFMIFIILSACSISGPGGRYLSHLKKVFTILKNNKKDAGAAAEKVYKYVEKNREGIEKASKQVKELSAKDTEKVYLPVLKTIQNLIEYVNTRTTREYPLGQQEKLALAFQILLN